MFPIAHGGHWVVYVFYALPVLIVIGSIAISIVRDRREQSESDQSAAP